MGDWTESKYHETRFGGMDKSVEPHTLDRDGGIMADEFNMMSRTQGLRTRKGWKVANDLSLYVSSLPGTPKSPLGLIPYIANITTVSEDDDDDDTGGDGGNGGVIGGLIDDGGDGGGGGGGSNPVSLTLTTPQAVVADVPFNISAAASAQYAGGSAHLEWDFQPDGQPGVSLTKGIRSGWSDKAWSAQATIWTADRTRTGVTATLKIGNTTKATKNMGYSVADMIPSLTSPIPYRQQFTFTVACKLGGATQTNYAGNGRGVAIRWQALDENGNSVSCHVSYSLTEWADGVGTYSARLTSVSATAAKLKVIVTYAGESQTAEATIQGAGLLRLPSSLHVYGNGGTMRINAVALTPSSLSVVAQVGGQTVDITDYLEMADGTPFSISAGWEDNVWEHDVRAKSGAAAATLALQLMSGETELASESITIADGLVAVIDTDESIKPGENIEATATISATGYALTRLPEGTVHLQIGPNAEVNEPNAENEFEITGVMEDVASGSYTVQAVDMRDGTPLATATVMVENIKSLLAEAINERVFARTGEAGPCSEDDDATTLRNAAISAIAGYANGVIAADGTFTPFTSSNHGIPAAEETHEWYESAYAIVKSAVARECSPTVAGTEEGGRYSGEKDSNVSGSGTQSDPYVLEDKDEFKARVAAGGYNSQMDDEDCVDAYSSYLHVVKNGTFYEGWVSGNMFAYHHASVALSYQCKKYTLTPYVGGIVDLYFQSYSVASTYDTFGHSAPASASTTAKCGSFQATAGQASESAWFGGNGSNLPAEARQIGASIGYCMTLKRAIIHYDFEHK